MKRPRLYPLFDTCPGALSFFFFSGRATCMYLQSQATKVHVVYCFFIARPVLLHVLYGVHKPDLTSFFEARATVPKCYTIIHGQLEEKPTEGQGLRIAICHNMQENSQKQLRHITNNYLTASIVSHKEPQYWDQMTKKTLLKKKDVLQSPRAFLYIVAIRDHNELGRHVVAASRSE